MDRPHSDGARLRVLFLEVEGSFLKTDGHSSQIGLSAKLHSDATVQFEISDFGFEMQVE
jgi:hypothetical protein